MDTGRNWDWEDTQQIEEAARTRACLKVCVDGGVREKVAAIGVSMYCRRGSTYTPIYYSAVLLSDVCSAFQCEAMALECAIDKLKRFLV